MGADDPRQLGIHVVPKWKPVNSVEINSV